MIMLRNKVVPADMASTYYENIPAQVNVAKNINKINFFINSSAFGTVNQL